MSLLHKEYEVLEIERIALETSASAQLLINSVISASIELKLFNAIHLRLKANENSTVSTEVLFDYIKSRQEQLIKQIQEERRMLCQMEKGH